MKYASWCGHTITHSDLQKPYCFIKFDHRKKGLDVVVHPLFLSNIFSICSGELCHGFKPEGASLCLATVYNRIPVI